MKQKTLYENIFQANNKLYARTYDTETQESSLEQVKYVPSIFIRTQEQTDLKEVVYKNNLKELTFSSMYDYKDALQTYKATGVTMYGNKVREQGYILDNFGESLDNDHPFHLWYLDIETAIDKTDPDANKVKDWKPSGSERAATAIITSIQIYDSKHKEYYILGLKKKWENTAGFKSDLGKINYFPMESEESMLKVFIKLLNKRNPTVLIGFNSFGYDYPYITNRIIRVLDKRTDLYFVNKEGRFVFNKSCLDGSWVKQLSPVNMVTHKEKENKFGFYDEFQWVGRFLDDYRELYLKYTFTNLTSYSLESVASHELGEGKVNHDEFTDFGDFYENHFEKFIEYGIKDVELLALLESKLKLVELNKMIAYTCGVNYNDVSGTVKQWNAYMFKEYLAKGYVLPLESVYSGIDSTLLAYAVENKEKLRLPAERQAYFERLYSSTDQLGGFHLRGQRFPGGVTRGTAKDWKWVFSFDYASLYPSVIQWANIGPETLILPKDLPEELLDLRAKYAIYYPKDVESSKLTEYDFKYMDEVFYNEEAREEMRKVLTKHNVSMTPNGMFFRKDERSIVSEKVEYIISNRKVYKKEMKSIEQQIENLKSKAILDEEDEQKIGSLSAERDKYEVYQMGLKILSNSMYGALSNKATVFAGHPEYFSGAVTSGARISNIIQAQTLSDKINELADENNKETEYGKHNRFDNICQIDTDSAYFSLEPVLKKKFGQEYEDEQSRERLIEFVLNFVNKIAHPLSRDTLDSKHSYMLNSYLPGKLILDHEVVADRFISLKPKMYFCRIFWNEGVTLSKHKLKVTGLSMIRSTTPKFYRKELKHAMEILIDGDLPKVKNYIEEVRESSTKQEPSDICINQGVTSIDYTYDEVSRKWKQKKGKKFLPAPINSRASLVHNKYILTTKSDIKAIEAGDKIGFLYMKEPNPAGSNVFAFINPKIFDEKLLTYIDYKTMFEKGFLSAIKLITDPLKWDLTPSDELIDEDEW